MWVMFHLGSQVGLSGGLSTPYSCARMVATSVLETSPLSAWTSLHPPRLWQGLTRNHTYSTVAQSIYVLVNYALQFIFISLFMRFLIHKLLSCTQ